MRPSLLLFCMCLFATVLRARADQHFSREVFFANSASADFYPYTDCSVSAPSTLETRSGLLEQEHVFHSKLPVDTAHFLSGPNSLRLHWSSAAQGGWSAEIDLYRFRNRLLDWNGDTLWMWLWTPEALPPEALPKIALIDKDGNHTAPVALGNVVKEAVPADKWTRIAIPFAAFHSVSLRAFEPHQMTAMVLSQGEADGRPHTLLLDEVRVLNDSPDLLQAPAAPQHLEAEPYERHIDLHWEDVADSRVADYVIYRSTGGGPFQAVGVQRPGPARYADFLGDPHTTATYRVTARTSALAESAPSTEAKATTHPMSDEELLTMVQRASFRYYWEAAELHSGMARESEPGDDDVIAVGASGFGIMATVVAADRHFITREAAVERLLTTAHFLERADRYHGVWPHFLSGRTGHTISLFGIYDDGADIVETSFLMEGLLTARQYFAGQNEKEAELRAAIDGLWRGVEWDWFQATPRRDALYWHWSPNYAFEIANRLQGWNEVMITYLLAIASPTHPVPGSLLQTGYERIGTKDAAGYGEHHTWFGIPLSQSYGPQTPGPLFFTQYSFMAFDPRGRRDSFSNYFVQNRNESLVSQAYSVANPNHFKGYGADSWGLTAVDGPDDQYHEYKPFVTDDGTLAPTGAVSAYPYVPAASMDALRHWYRDEGAALWGIYGFCDAFNETENWVSGITMGLNQAPQTVMIENGRTGLVWRMFLANPGMADALKRAGFRPDPANTQP